MKNATSISDEMINAYVDGELSDAERHHLLSAAMASDALRERICAATYVKEQVQQAYPDQFSPSESQPVQSQARYAIAASLLFAGLAALLYMALAPQLNRADKSHQIAAVSSESTKILFHISSENTDATADLLEQVELVLDSYASRQQPLRVEVVANHDGLRMLQSGRSVLAGHIAQLHQRYPNLNFAACGNTLDRLRKSSKEKIDILPSAVIVQSGVSFVARRQRDGWLYIKA